MDINTTTEEPTMTETTATFVGLQHDQLNLSIFRVTPLEDGMEMVEYLSRGTEEREEAAELMDRAKSMAQVTGSKSSTFTDRAADGTERTATYYANRWMGPRLVPGIHRAQATLSAEQRTLKDAMANQAEPSMGARYIVAELTGYQPIQDRAYAHRECGCGNGVTTYREGTVTAITHWMDNSVEATVLLDSGRTATVTMKAPSGDICY